MTQLDFEILSQLQNLYAQKRLVGKFKNIPIEVYHHPDCPGISNTMLNWTRKGPGGFFHLREQARGGKKADYFKLGSAAHDAFLLPEVFKVTYAILPDDINRRTNEGKKKYADFMEANASKVILDREDYEAAVRMAEKMRAHPTIATLWSKLEPEVSFWFYEGDTLCKTRPDLHSEDGIIIDYKTAADISPSVYKKEIVNRNYDRSLAMQATGLERIYGRNFLITCLAAIEKESLDNEVFLLSTRTLETGKSLYLRDLQRYTSYVNIKQEELKKENFQLIEIPEYGHSLDNR